jgi:lipid A 3-O-deacylase
MLHHEMQETWNRRNRAVSARFRLALACFASLLALAATPSFAADLPPRPAVAVAPLPKPSLMTELRLGIFAHDPSSPESGSADINGEILFLKWFGADSSWAVLYPRLHVGGTANTAGKTSTAYAGLTWSTDFLSSFFIEGTLGGAVHNGYTGDGSRAGENSLGCSPLFRESASLGYRFTPQISVMATVEHYSNAGLCSQNRGLTNAGVRLGYSF